MVRIFLAGKVTVAEPQKIVPPGQPQAVVNLVTNFRADSELGGKISSAEKDTARESDVPAGIQIICGSESEQMSVRCIVAPVGFFKCQFASVVRAETQIGRRLEIYIAQEHVNVAIQLKILDRSVVLEFVFILRQSVPAVDFSLAPRETRLESGLRFVARTRT